MMTPLAGQQAGTVKVTGPWRRDGSFAGNRSSVGAAPPSTSLRRRLRSLVVATLNFARSGGRLPAIFGSHSRSALRGKPRSSASRSACSFARIPSGPCAGSAARAPDSQAARSSSEGAGATAQLARAEMLSPVSLAAGSGGVRTALAAKFCPGQTSRHALVGPGPTWLLARARISACAAATTPRA